MWRITRIEYKSCPFVLLGVYAPKDIVPEIQFSKDKDIRGETINDRVAIELFQ